MSRVKRAVAASGSNPTGVIGLVRSTVGVLRDQGDLKIREQMQRQFGITGKVAETAFGVRMADVQRVAKSVRKRGKENAAWNHELALALWETGQYEARMVSIHVDVPSQVTSSQMDGWAKSFTDWAVCDTACFKLFDRSPYALAKVEKWSKSSHEFVKRAAFALLAGVALHDKDRPDGDYMPFFEVIRRGADDERNFVKKGVSWALRGVGKRSPGLRKHAQACAQELASSDDPSERWVGKDALRDFARR